MKIDAIQKALHALPFQPFHIHLADGGRLGPIVHQDFLAINPAGRELTLYLPDNTCHTVDLMLVTRLESKSRDGTGEAESSLREESHGAKPIDVEHVRRFLHSQ